MSIIFFIITMFFTITAIFFGIQLLRSVWNYKIPKSYYVVYWIIVTISIVGSFITKKIGYFSDLEAKVLAICLFLNFEILLVSIITQTSTEKIRAPFSQVLFNGIKRLNLEYQNLTAKEFAEENNIEYISDAVHSKININPYANAVIARNNKYISLHPANDGMPTLPIEWYGNFIKEVKGKERLRCEMIMDNQQSFDCITNLDEIILSMIHLYKDNIDKDVFIASEGFAIRLEDEPTESYVGKAKLVLTDNAIKNSKVAVDEKEAAKKYFINDFLDHFIGWNFGVVINSNPKLEKELKEFNELVISKGLREYAGTGFDVWHNQYVQHYELKTE